MPPDRPRSRRRANVLAAIVVATLVGAPATCALSARQAMTLHALKAPPPARFFVVALDDAGHGHVVDVAARLGPPGVPVALDAGAHARLAAAGLPALEAELAAALPAPASVHVRLERDDVTGQQVRLDVVQGDDTDLSRYAVRGDLVVPLEVAGFGALAPVTGFLRALEIGMAGFVVLLITLLAWRAPRAAA